MKSFLLNNGIQFEESWSDIDLVDCHICNGNGIFSKTKYNRVGNLVTIDFCKECFSCGKTFVGNYG